MAQRVNMMLDGTSFDGMEITHRQDGAHCVLDQFAFATIVS